MPKQTLCQILHGKHTKHFMQKWVEPLNILTKTAAEQNSNNKNLGLTYEVVFPHNLFAQYFMQEAREDFETYLKQCFGNGVEIVYTCNSDEKPERPQFSAIKQKTSCFRLNNFIAGSKNNFVLDTLKSIAAGKIKTETCSPLVLWGKSGSGKTHLLTSLANDFKQNFNFKNNFSSPKLLSDTYMVEGYSQKTRVEIFAADSFFLDDFETISNFPEIQSEISLIFDYFLRNNKIIIISCKENPEKMLKISDDIKNRLQNGILLELKEADLETRLEYAKQKSASCQLEFNQRQLLSLATQFKTIRQLEGVINKISAYNYSRDSINKEKDFEKILKRAGAISLSNLTSSKIIEFASDYFNISPANLIGEDRSHKTVRARQVAMYLCRTMLNLPYPEIGEIFGGKDQTTAMYSTKKITALQASSTDITGIINNLKNKCLGLD